MVYRALADLVLVLHLAFIVFVLAGGLLAMRWRSAPYLHLPAVLWAILIEIFDWVCPLTPVENAFRRLAGAPEYAGGFVENYLLPVIYPSGMSYGIQLGLAALVVLTNAITYWFVWRSLRHANPKQAVEEVKG